MQAAHAVASDAPAEPYDRLLDIAGISVDRLPMLRVIFDRVATSCSESLRTRSTANCFLSVTDIGTGRIGDVLDRYDGRTIVAVFYAVEWDARILIGLERRLVFSLLEALLGGDGSEPAYDDDRALSAIETKVAQALFEQVGTALTTSFAAASETTFRLERIESRMQFAVIGRRNNGAVVAKFGFTVFDRGGDMFIVIPQIALNPIRQNLARDATGETSGRDPRWARQIETEVSRAGVTLTGVLDEQFLTLDDIANFRVGQILKLQATPKSRVKLECNDEPLFWCQLGQADGHYTLRVDEFVDADKDILSDILRQMQ